jgi:hypothetical protein
VMGRPETSTVAESTNRMKYDDTISGTERFARGRALFVHVIDVCARGDCAASGLRVLYVVKCHPPI